MLTVIDVCYVFFPQTPNSALKTKDANNETSKDGLAYACLLKNELLAAGIEDVKVNVKAITYAAFCLYSHSLTSAVFETDHLVVS